MTHAYEAEVAQRYGIVTAVLLRNFYYWIERNREHGENFHDGRYWTYETIDSLDAHFPEMSKRTITRTLKKMEEDGLLLKGNYNKLAFDRTTWYALSDYAYSLMNQLHHPDIKNDNLSYGQNDNMGDVKMTTTIPTISTTISSTNKSFDKSNDMSNSDSWTSRIQRVVESWNAMASSAGLPCLTRVSAGSERYKRLRSRLSEFGDDAFSRCIENVRDSDFLRNANFFSFDWMIRPNNFPKVLEGNYNDRNKANADAYSYDDYEGPEG